MTAAYAAPASRVLTVLHQRDPDAPAGTARNPASGRDEPYGGVALCGLVMWASELWQEIEQHGKDRVCPGCAGIPVQETGLW